MNKVYRLCGFLLLMLVLIFLIFKTPNTNKALISRKYTNPYSRFIDGPNGLRIHVRDQGNPQGDVIVLIHGTSASLHTWEPLIALLKSDYRIITYSQPGHGLTGPSDNGDYSFKGMAQALNTVVNALQLDSFILGGNSMGGWVSWRYALINPKKVNALLLLAASGMPLREGEVAPPLNLAFSLQKYALGRFITRNITPYSVVEKSLLQTVSVDAIVTEEMINRYWEMIRLPGNRQAAASRAQVNRELHFADQVHNINAPTLLLWGEQDKLVYASAAQSFSERLPHSKAIIYKGVGHIPMEEVPQKVANDIREFLKTL